MSSYNVRVTTLILASSSIAQSFELVCEFGRNLQCVPVATTLPPPLVRNVTSMNASVRPTLVTRASTSTSVPPGPGDT